MIVTCPQCATRYRIAENKFPPGGRTVRCSKCGHSWFEQPSAPDKLAEGAIDAKTSEASPASAVPPKGQTLASFSALSGLVAVVTLVVWALVHYQALMVSVWPQSAALYRTIGIAPKARGVLLTDVSYRRDTEAGLPVLTIQGVAVNTTIKEMTVPQIEVALTDGDGRAVDRWVFSAGIGRLAPGQKAEFATRRIDPPASARQFQISFARRHR